jgi:hypothetical protein
LKRNIFLEAAVSAILAGSAVVGAAILMTDGYLWAAAPSHAYGLVAFVVLDLGLAALVWKKVRLALLGTAILGAIQFTFMVGDVLVGQPTGLPSGLWEQYLLGDGYFVVLLIIQLVVVAGGLFGLAYGRSMNHGSALRYSSPEQRMNSS